MPNKISGFNSNLVFQIFHSLLIYAYQTKAKEINLRYTDEADQAHFE